MARRKKRVPKPASLTTEASKGAQKAPEMKENTSTAAAAGKENKPSEAEDTKMANETAEKKAVAVAVVEEEQDEESSYEFNPVCENCAG